MTDTNMFFQDLGAEASALAQRLEQINANLRYHEIPEFDGTTRGLLHQFFQMTPEAVGMYDAIESYMQNAVRVTKKMEEFRADLDNHWHIEHRKDRALKQEALSHEKLVRASERRDMWTLWIQQTIRWIGGAALALLMYSGAIWLSNHCSFIHVPTKDWFTKAAEQPKP